MRKASHSEERPHSQTRNYVLRNIIFLFPDWSAYRFILGLDVGGSLHRLNLVAIVFKQLFEQQNEQMARLLMMNTEVTYQTSMLTNTRMPVIQCRYVTV